MEDELEKTRADKNRIQQELDSTMAELDQI